MADEGEYLYSDETHKIIRCAMNVANYFGTGFLESVYQKALEEEFRENNIPLDTVYMDIDYMESYKDFTINPEHYADFAELTAELKYLGVSGEELAALVREEEPVTEGLGAPQRETVEEDPK